MNKYMLYISAPENLFFFEKPKIDFSWHEETFTTNIFRKYIE